MTEHSGSHLDVRGEVVLGQDVASFRGAVVRILLEDVSRADGLSTVVASQIIDKVDHPPHEVRRLPFELSCPHADKRARYSVRVHVDLRGDGEIHLGDYITMQSYPVVADQLANQMLIKVREVT